MKKILILCAAAAAAAVTGCATPDQPAASAEAVQAREYPTGSNIPRKRAPGETAEGVSTYDREALERARNQLPQTARPGLGGTP